MTPLWVFLTFFAGGAAFLLGGYWQKKLSLAVLGALLLFVAGSLMIGGLQYYQLYAIASSVSVVSGNTTTTTNTWALQAGTFTGVWVTSFGVAIMFYSALLFIEILASAWIKN